MEVRPMGTPHQDNLYDNCEPLTGVSVTIDVTEEMVAIPSANSVAGFQSNGIGFQLNCLPKTVANEINASSWQQYIMVLSRTGQLLRWGVNNWNYNPNLPDGIIDDGDDLATIPADLGAGYACILPGYRIEISLKNDSNDNVIGVTFSMYNGTTPVFTPKYVPLTSLKDVNGNQVTNGYLSPIVDIILVIGGYANGAHTTLIRGVGNITYRANNALTAVTVGFPGCTPGTFTAESSNVLYGAFPSAPSTNIVQTFEVPQLTLAGRPATLYATAANNQQHVFCQGVDGGLYHVFYDPGDNTVHGPEQWATGVASDPATLYATAANNQQHVFYRGTDGGIYNVFYDPGSNTILHPPERWATEAVGDPATLYATAANNQQHVFYRGTDGIIYNVFYDPGDHQIHGPEPWIPSGAVRAAGDPATLYATGANNQQHVFYRGTNGAIYNVFYDPGDHQIHGPELWASGATSDPATLYATGADNQQHVFYLARGGIYNVFYDPGAGRVYPPEHWGLEE
jgi:Repeat of unknown function (DUF346)